jgi:hypothetical protein
VAIRRGQVSASTRSRAIGALHCDGCAQQAPLLRLAAGIHFTRPGADHRCRADDTTFGILHSRLHELWSLRLGTSLEDRPRYTPTTCFETFPFPAGLTPADTAHQRAETLPEAP